MLELPMGLCRATVPAYKYDRSSLRESKGHTGLPGPVGVVDLFPFEDAP
jgi:hypothetical protein